MLRKLLDRIRKRKTTPVTTKSSVDNNDFLTLLDQLLSEQNIELPSIPKSDGRSAYIDFLSLAGYEEEELLPVIDREQLTGEMYGATIAGLLSAIEQKDKKLIKAMAWLAKNTVTGIDNTNLIISDLSSNLLKELASSGVSIPTCYAGVFPTDSCNAQVRIHNECNLILIDTGYMEMAEGVVTCLFSKESNSVKVCELNAVIEKYVVDRQRPGAKSFSAKGVNWGSGTVPTVINAVEEFVLSHEIGHLSLGHISKDITRTLNPRFVPELEVCEKDINQEFAADLWASKHLVDRGKSATDKDERILLAIGGSTIALGIGLLVESSKKQAGLVVDNSHPPASERMYMLDILWEILDVHHLTGLGEKFKEILEECIDEYYPEAEMPPFLNRELNKKIIPVLDSLNIEYSHASFVKEFI
jgi:hypothetical protein